MLRRIRLAVVCAIVGMALAPLVAAGDTLHVVATTPDLADLARAVGGEAVDVTSLAKGPQDIHFVEPRPSFVRALHRADLLVRIGMDLEIGWLPALLRSARNPGVSPGAVGDLDASLAIEALEVPTASLDRSMGDVHPFGNPHYLTDPLNGLAVARLLRDRLAALRPGESQRFDAGYARLASRIMTALVGEALATSATPEEIEAKLRAGALEASPELGGWLRRARDSGVSRAVQDHRYWPYFAQRFGLDIVQTLEPRPGIAPTTSLLQKAIDQIRDESIPVVLATPYYDPRHARFVSAHSGARVARMAHQVGAVPGTTDYLSTIEYNVRQVFGE